MARHIYDYNAIDENGEKGAYVFNPIHQEIQDRVFQMIWDVSHPQATLDFSGVDSILISIKNGCTNEEAARIAHIIDNFDEGSGTENLSNF